MTALNEYANMHVPLLLVVRACVFSLPLENGMYVCVLVLLMVSLAGSAYLLILVFEGELCGQEARLVHSLQLLEKQ